MSSGTHGAWVPETSAGPGSMAGVDMDALFDTSQPLLTPPPRYAPVTVIDTVDLYAGAGGLDEGLRMLDPASKGLGAEKWAVACATARNAGHLRWNVDVSHVAPDSFVGIERVLGGPPCQGLTGAGLQRGRTDLPIILRALAKMMDYPDEAAAIIADVRERCADHRSDLILEPLRWALVTRPRVIFLEQVPEAMPVWKLMEELLPRIGYKTRAIEVSTEQYGVPETRRRALFMASLDRQPGIPQPTHSAYYPKEPHRLDPGVEKWVSMAEALPSWANCKVGFPRKDDKVNNPSADGYRARDMRTTDRPAWGLTEKVRSWKRIHLDDWDDTPIRVEVEEAAVLHSFRPHYGWAGSPSSQFLQIANAVPPLLAYHALGSTL